MASDKLLKVRSIIKKRKPTYKRVQSHQFPKLNDGKWRKPKGMGNKVRRGRRGKPSMPEVGFGSPKSVRGLNKKGLIEVIINNSSELSNIDSKTQIAIIGSTVGSRKRLEILNEAKKLKLEIGNVKDIEKSIKALTKEKKVKKEKKVAPKAEESKKEDETKKDEKPSKEAKKWI